MAPSGPMANVQKAVGKLQGAGISVPPAVSTAVAQSTTPAQLKTNVATVKKQGVPVHPAVQAVVTAAQTAHPSAPLAPVQQGCDTTKEC